MGKSMSVQERRARERKKQAAQAQKEREMWQKARKPLLISVIAIAVIALLWWIAANFIFLPNNTVRVLGGKTIGTEDSWLVCNLGTSSKPEYVHMGTVTAPAGYTIDPDYSYNADTNVQTRYYRADDETALVQNIFYTGVANKSAQAMAETVAGSGYFAEVSDPVTVKVGNYDVTYVFGKMSSYDDSGNVVEGQGSASLYAYIDGIRSSSVCCVLSTAQGASDQLPAADDLMPTLESALSVLTLTE